MTVTQDHAIIDNVMLSKIAEEFEIAWSNVFKVINHFMSQHDQFGFKLIEEKSNPRVEDMLLSLKVMGGILAVIEMSIDLDTSEQRMLLNAKQQIILFERATLAISNGEEDEYSSVVDMMRKQAQF